LLDLYLVGTGGLAREVLGWLVFEKSPLLSSLKGFLVTDPNAVSGFAHGYPIIHIDELKYPFRFIPTIGHNGTREKLVNKLLKVGGIPESYISCSVPIGLNVSIGVGCVVNPRSSISSDVQLGDYVLINCNTGVGHDVVVGDFTSILGHVAINGNVEIESHCLIGSGVIIHPGKKVEQGSTVGMGAVVFRKVKAGTTVLGNPAKKIG
jgi:acetyltransferase EpsM